MIKRYEYKYAGKPLVIELGKLAQQTNGSCLVKYDGTTVLGAVVASEKPKEGIDFFPLSVDYMERYYAKGKIPGGYIKREGKPTDNAVLISRAIDRPIRPFFPEELRNDVVVSIIAMEVSEDSAPVIAGTIASVLSILISDIPFNNVVASCDVAIVEDKIILNPTKMQREASILDLTIAASKEKVVMIEAGANEITNDQMLEAIKVAHEEIKNLCGFLENIAEENKKEKFEIDLKPFEKNRVFKNYIESKYSNEIKEVLKNNGSCKEQLKQGLKQLKEEIEAKINEILKKAESFTEIEKIEAFKEAGIYFEKAESILNDKLVSQLVEEGVTKVEKQIVKKLVIEEEFRVDKRQLEELRPLIAEVGLLETVHGSGLFARGETQVLSIATLGKASEEQKLDGMELHESKRYMHHYNFPGFSVGEAKPSRAAGRREVGHGALAEKALIPVLPPKEEFPYSIRVVSEVLSSNGSTSQASVCGSSLALMDAGVPIKKAVAGISTGLFTKPDGSHKMVTDIQGLEDFFGEMDFKVAGTEDGITAIQVDIKNDGLTYEIIKEAFEKTERARKYIIKEVMQKAIKEPRKEVSKYAPKIEMIKIAQEMIRELIGPGGKTINKIIEETGVEIDIEDDGLVFIYGDDKEKMAKAIEMIEIVTRKLEVGDIVGGIVLRIAPFGAFIDLGGGKEGLAHISKLAKRRVNKVEEILKEGQIVKAKIDQIDEDGKISLDLREVN